MSLRKIKVGILGATGSVGQKLVSRLSEHPWFEVAAVAASERSAGRRYDEAVHWLEGQPVPAAVADLEVRSVRSDLDCELLFSALDGATARALEPQLAAAGHVVVSNASALRMDPAVPLVVPEVNPGHLDLVASRARGFVVTNPNCATVGLVLSLKPLLDAFGVETVQLTTLQAVSGAGYPGVPALDILGNAIPFIGGEEDKLAEEPGKILGRLRGPHIEELPITISAQVTRVPVIDGHLLSVSVQLGRRVAPEEALEVLEAYCGPSEVQALPSAPERPLVVFRDGPYPQPRLHAELGDGMTVSIGRVRRCPVHDLRYVALVHNTQRGAAGAAILNGELLVERGLLRRGRD